MVKKYYFMNGENGVSDSLYLNNNGIITNVFEDISEIDLITMDIDKENVRETIREYNSEKSMPGIFYVCSYPARNNTISSYAPIFKYSGQDFDYYYDNLRSFALERLDKHKKGNKFRLEQDEKLKEFAYVILYNILDDDLRSFTDIDSIVSYRVKEILNDKFDKYDNMRSDLYLTRMEESIDNSLSNYIEMRNLVLAYLWHLKGYKTNVKCMINETEEWNNRGIILNDGLSRKKEKKS